MPRTRLLRWSWPTCCYAPIAGHILPETGFGLGYAIDLNRVSDEGRALLEASLEQLGDVAADASLLAEALVPDMAPQAQSIIEADWEAKVLR